MAANRGPGRPPGSKNKNKGNNRETAPTDSRQVAARSKNQQKKQPGKSSSAEKSSKKSSAGKNVQAKTPEKGVPGEIISLIMLAAGIFLVISMQSDLAGTAGSMISDFLKGLFGFAAYFMPYLIIIYSFLSLIRQVPAWRISAVIWIILFEFGVSLVNEYRFIDQVKYGFHGFTHIYQNGSSLNGGGLFGTYAGGSLYNAAGAAGLFIVAALLIIISLGFLFKQPAKKLADSARSRKNHGFYDDYPLSVTEKSRRSNAVKEKTDKKPDAESAAEIDVPKPARSSDDEMIQKIKDDQRREGFLARMGFSKSDKKPDAGQKEEPPKWPRKISGNQKDILDLVWREHEFGPSEKRDGFGLDGSQESLHQRKERDLSVADRKTQPLYKITDEEGIPESISDEKAQPAKEESKDPDYEVGGASVATAKSKTEEGESDVSVTPTKRGRYKLPPVDLLKAPSVESHHKGPSENLNEKAALLEKTLRSFNVEAKVVNVISGPSVTRYEIQPAIGVKVNRITSLSDDIALNMKARSIRIEAPIPGKAAVGIEIENSRREAVTLREIIGSQAFRSNKSRLAFSVGRDIGGSPVVADLGKMPHLLIAGATGSGKSVCINTIIASILYKARPEEVKMILIDPKMVELGNYNGIPHLLIPVVTDAGKAASALNWAVAEMTDRYKKFAASGVRDIGAYNQLMKEKNEKEEILPQIVIIIDELSDLMMVASSQVEDAICRLAQLARAAGMHLVVATQRPSVDVITGLIKANIPSRIAFMVSSQIDSRTIIDMPGAEKLVGNGDMLFKPQDLNKPKRIQGPFISDSEVYSLIDYVKSQGKDAEYDQQIIDQIEKGKDYQGADDGDELLMDAIGVVVNAGQASVSMLQRRFRIGYNRAARIVDMMQARGIVGPPDGARPRQVLITEAEYEKMKEEGF